MKHPLKFWAYAVFYILALYAILLAFLVHKVVLSSIAFIQAF